MTHPWKFCTLLLLALTLITGCSGDNALGGEPQALEKETLTIHTRAGEDLLFQVEIADDSGEQRTGMMYRTAMDEDSGMLFLFPDDDFRSFWMKDTPIPLDMLFLTADGRIVHIHPMARPQDYTRITYAMPVRAVLELKGGMAGQLGIAEGDRVLHPAFRNVLAP